MAELDDLDRKTRKLMTANRALHPQSDVDRTVPPCNEGAAGAADTSNGDGREEVVE